MKSKKVILTGNFGVGKTSLFNRFIHGNFSEKYLTTIGVKVDKKVVTTDSGEELSMLIWDIAGEVSQNKVPLSYFLGASGIIYVFDLSRPLTYQTLENNINYLKNLLPKGVIKIVGNKKDLLTEDEVDAIVSEISLEVNTVTSAKTGENVDQLFVALAEEMLSVTA